MRQLLTALETSEKSGFATEEIIRILGADYDSLEALLSVTMEIVDDRLKGTIEKDDVSPKLFSPKNISPHLERQAFHSHFLSTIQILKASLTNKP